MRAAVPPIVEATVKPPRGAAPRESWDLLDNDAWWREVLSALQTAAEIEISSYLFDEPSLHALLVKRLADKRDRVAVRLHLDGKTLLNDDKFYYQRSRVKKLHELGATVYLCSGRKPNGVFHKKAVIADRRWMFSGGANLTHSARHANSEFLMKLTGKGVMDALASLEQERLKARLWNGCFS